MANSLLSLTWAVVLLGQAAAEPAGPKGDRGEELRLFKEKAAELELYRGSEAKKPQPLLPEPVLRYSNAERDIGSLDGATFLWLDGERPVAAVSLSVRRVNSGVFRELTSFSQTPLECRAGGTARWSPKTGGLLAKPLPEAPAPADKKPPRLTQMRTLARRFTAVCYHPKTDAPTDLRLLPQPLYRFADEKAGVLDGGLFAFVVSNDPEMFLMLEAVSDGDGKSHWRYSLARMSSLKETVRLDDKEIWSVPNYYQDRMEDRKTGPYAEAKVGTFTASAASPDKK
jgi:hypothetical protein